MTQKKKKETETPYIVGIKTVLSGDAMRDYEVKIINKDGNVLTSFEHYTLKEAKNSAKDKLFDRELYLAGMVRTEVWLNENSLVVYCRK